jgi:protein-S-isoprenylcysteine O-methyltransferase Ste14
MPDTDAMKRTRIGWSLVALQFALLVLLILVPRRSPQPWPVAIGGLMAVGGVLLGLWSARVLGSALTATPVPIVGAGLRTSGPYAWVRHPIYSAVLLLAWGATIAVGSWSTLVVALALSVFFVAKSRWEDGLLAAEYRAEWPAWASRTGALVPHPRRP